LPHQKNANITGTIGTVINANKKSLEICLGVDLIFHHSAFDSCVLVQYKRLKKFGTSWGFDLNDEQLCKQLAAIEEIKKLSSLQTHYLFNATLGDLYFQTGHIATARNYYLTAIEQTQSQQEKELLKRKLVLTVIANN